MQKVVAMVKKMLDCREDEDEDGFVREPKWDHNTFHFKLPTVCQSVKPAGFYFGRNGDQCLHIHNNMGITQKKCTFWGVTGRRNFGAL